jgi:thiol-disulfide isomerase/thioredoxin
MKKIICICLAIAMFGCKKELKIDYASISGKIENPTDKIVSISNGKEKIKEIALKEDGSFNDTLKIESGYYTLTHGRESTAIYLTPECDFTVTLNTKEFDETLKYTGEGSENNNYLAAKFLADEKSNFDYAKVYALEEDDFMAIMEEVKSSKLTLLKDAKNISSDFRALEEKNTEYEYLSFLQNYAPAHSYYTKKVAFKPSEEFTKRMEALDYTNEEDYSNFIYYQKLVQSHFSNKISKTDNPSEVFKMINEEAFPALKKDLANMLNYQISPNNEKNEAYYNGLMAMSSDDKFKEALTTKYNKVKKLAKGMPSPKFKDYENHKGGTTSLEDLKGKYVYIDVWATWCGPCIREIPSLKEVEKQFHDKNIAFVSTSIDVAKDHKVWESMVKEKQLGGIQLLADNDWNSQFVKDYAIEGIPRFILIDPDGNIVSADAPRPSDPNLIEMLKALKI